MRATSPLLLSLGLLLMAQAGIRAQAPDTTVQAPVPGKSEADDTEAPVDTAKVIEKLVRAQKEFEVRKKEIAATALGRFSSGATSEAAAVQLYFTCEQIVQDRLPDLDGQTKQEVKDKQDKMKQQASQIEDTPGRAAVLQLQLQYLVLTMEAPTMKDRGALISRLKDFASKAVALVRTYTSPPVDPAHKPGGNGKSSKREQEKQRETQREERARHQVVQLAQQSVMSSIFAQAYNLQNYFKPIEGWPSSPLDLATAYTGMIIPWYHENKKEFIAPAWDEYLGHEAALQRCALDDRGYARWGVGAYKNLLWAKWTDLLHNGNNRITAADELSKLCSENPTHPSVGNWIEQLSQEVDSLLYGKGNTPPRDVEASAASVSK